MKDYILKPGAFISKSTTDKTSDVPGLSLEKYIVQVLNGETCCLKNIVADSLTINGIEVGAGLKLKDDALMTTTLTSVVDRDNTASPLKLSTNLVSVGSTLQIATDNTTYIDAEDSLGNNRFTVSRTVGQQVVNVDFASNPTLNEKVGAIRTYQDGVNLSDAISVEKNGQTTFTERVKIEADSTATTQSTAVIQSSTTNAGIAIVPNGTGAITAQVPDGTVAGGNARGQYAVDFQMSRTANNQVASSNFSTIAGGANNRASGIGVFIGGGIGNAAGGNDHYQAIVGGQNNFINASGHSFIGGGQSNSISTGSGLGYNSISGGQSNSISFGTNVRNSIISGGASNSITSGYSTISGGQSNTASTNSHATVVGGQGNTSSGQYSVSGGISNVASGRGSVALGESCTASATNCIAIGISANASASWNIAIGRFSNASGGVSNLALIGGQCTDGAASIAVANSKTTSAGCFAFGYDSLAYLRNQFVQSPTNIYGGNIVYAGSSQASQVVAVRAATLNSAGTTVLSLDGTGTTNLIIPNGNNRVWNVTVKTVAVVTAIVGTATGVTVGDVFMENKSILFKKIGGVSSVVDLATDNTFADGLMGTSSMAYTAGASQELALTYTGPIFAGGGSVTVRVVSKVELVEVAY